MFLKFREIIYGILFGLGAVLIDAIMDSRQSGESITTQLFGHPAMLLYRGLFVVMGILFGWLVSQRKTKELEFQEVSERLDQLRLQCEKESMLIHGSLQVVLGRTDLHLPEDTEKLIRQAYQYSEEMLGRLR
jgi:hypothetical protein